MGAYKYYNPSTQKWEIVKSKSIINADGTNEYTPDEVKEMDDKITILSGVSGTKEKANKEDLETHKAENTTQVHVNALASEAEAVAGETNNKFMTPLRTKQAIDEALEITLDDPSGGPGRALLQSGTLESGYFGFVSAGELITGAALASAIGLSKGTSQFSSEGWFKYAYKEKVCFVAKKPLRHTVSWNDINAIGAVFGTKTVNIGGLTFKVRLMTGGNGDPASAAGGEWNQIMYGLHESQEPNWGVYTDGDLLTHSSFGSGSYSWCQEVHSSHSSYRVLRGDIGVASFGGYSAAGASAYYGWRPVLELVS